MSLTVHIFVWILSVVTAFLNTKIKVKMLYKKINNFYDIYFPVDSLHILPKSCFSLILLHNNRCQLFKKKLIIQMMFWLKIQNRIEFLHYRYLSILKWCENSLKLLGYNISCMCMMFHILCVCIVYVYEAIHILCVLLIKKKSQ